MADILRQYQGKLCSLLDSSSDTLESLTVELYSNYIIDESVKNNVLREKGYTGARILLDMAILKVKQSPGAKDAVFKAMETQGILKQLVTEMRTKEQSFTPPQYTDDKKEIGSPSTSEPGKIKCEQEVFEEATTLQDRFDDLLDEVRKHSTQAICDIGLLRLRLNSHLGRARENTAAVNDVLSNIDQIHDSSAILNCLIRCGLIGYMNYRLLDVFQKLIREPQFDQCLQNYEDALQRFLKSADLGTLAQVFDSNPTVAPVTFAGLPRFTVHLNDSWEGKSVHRWDQLLKGQFDWPSHIQIVRISKKCIIIEYGVLPFFAPDVVRDLTNPQVLSLLEEQGVTKIKLSDQLKKIAKLKGDIDNLLLEAAKYCSDTEIMELLLKRGANVHATSTEWQYSPLYLSAESGNCAAVKLLIEEYGADIDKEDIEGRSPLHIAAEEGKKEVVELLLKAGADIHKLDEDEHTTLHHAAGRNGNIETVELVLNNGAITDINKKDWWAKTALHHAAENGHDDIVTLLVESGLRETGANTIDEQDVDGNTPLHHAASHGHKSTVELLLSYNADYTIENEDGQTILHSAAEGGNIEIVKLFLKLCGNSYLHNESTLPNLCTPLHCAVLCGHVEIVELLLQSDADPNFGGERGYTPLHVTAKYGDKAGIAAIAELLLGKDADPNAVTKSENRTPLHYAARDGHYNMVEVLLNHGANINEKDESNGFTPLHLAVIGADHSRGYVQHKSVLNIDELSQSSQDRTVRLLLTEGAKVNEQDNHGHTPIYYAKQVENEDVVQILFQFGASRDVKQKITCPTTISSRDTDEQMYLTPVVTMPRDENFV